MPSNIGGNPVLTGGTTNYDQVEFVGGITVDVLTKMNGQVEMHDLYGGMAGLQTLKIVTATGIVVTGDSTQKIKKEISPISKHVPLDSILKLKPRTFKYRGGDGSIFGGFIAEELADAHPIFASWGKDWSYDEEGDKIQISDSKDPDLRYQKDSDKSVPITYDTMALLAIAIEKIQELESRIKVLEG